MDRNHQILILGKAIEAVFTSSEWTEVGYLTSTDSHVNSHPRLLRSLSWGDNDYKEHVFDTVAYILRADEQNLKRLVEYEPIARWLRLNDALGLHGLRADLYGMTVPEVMPSGSEAALAALADAQALLESRGPSSAVDRVHTGLHGFLRGACLEAGIKFETDMTANQLLKRLLDDHPALHNLGAREMEIKKLIRTSAAIVDAMGTLRNHASLAHPNEELLDQEEALLVINLGRSLLHFFSAKFKTQEIL